MASKRVGATDVIASNDIVCEECKTGKLPDKPVFDANQTLISFPFTLAKNSAGTEKLFLRLYRDQGTTLMIERWHEAVDKSRASLIMPVKNLALLREFLEKDEFYSRFRGEYERIYDKAKSEFAEADMSSLDGLSFEGDPIKALKTIRNIRSVSTFLAAVDKWIKIFGAEHYTYARLVRDHPNPQVENRFWLVGYPPAYSQLYLQRRWYENDPYVIRARNTDEPYCGHETPTMSDGQARLREAGHRHGINALMVMPVHGHNKAHTGLLYVSLNTDRLTGESMLQEHQYQFQLLAREIHNWWGERLHHEAVQKYQLEDLEIELLRLMRSDVTRAAEQAEELNIPAAKVYKLNQNIKNKFDTNDLDVAVKMADVYGLL